MSKIVHRPENGYSAHGSDGSVTVDYYYSDVHCRACRNSKVLVHETCEHCGFHGKFEEPGDCLQCPECGWGYPT